MKKTKPLCVIILGLLFLLPFINVSPAQGSYVGIQDDDEYLWKLSVFTASWRYYFEDQLEQTLDILWPLGPFTHMTKVYTDWVVWRIPLPQSHWPFNIAAIGFEETGTLLSPFDNTIITSTPVNATAGYEVPGTQYFNSFYNGTWYIVNDTSSFLRQTFNLTLAFSPYGIMGVPFAPKTINWASFITEFLGVMNSRGGFYDNTSATAKSNGYSLNVPARGFENNSVAIDIDVRYNSNGVLTYYGFSYGGKMLVNYKLDKPVTVSEEDLAIIIYGSSFVVIFGILIVLMMKRMK